MSKIDTIEKLSSKLDRELAWRKKELITLNSHVDIHHDNKHILRAVFPIICAHYEGFLKNSTALYLQHISDLCIPLIDLKNVFAPFTLSSAFLTCDGSKRSTVRARVIEEYNNISNEPMIVSNPRACIDTESNPKPDVLTEILESLALDSSQFHTKHTFINDSLLKNRHAIVHGEYCDIDLIEFKQVMRTTLEIMEAIKDLVIVSSEKAYYMK